MLNSQTKVPMASSFGDVSSKASSSFDGVSLDFIKRIGSLESITTEFDDKLRQANAELAAIKKESNIIVQQNHRIESLVWGGFFVLLMVVLGTIFSYFEYVSSDAMKYQSDLARVWALEDNHKNSISDLGDKIIIIESENKDLHKVNACLKNRKLWEINLCFE